VLAMLPELAVLIISQSDTNHNIDIIFFEIEFHFTHVDEVVIIILMFLG